MRRIGILGGTFNPPHLGHLNIALASYEKLNLDEVWFIPAGNPPHKNVSRDISIIDRFNMVKLMINDYPHFKCKDFEFKKMSKCYSYETLQEIKSLYPDDELFFLIGADSLETFNTWVRPDIISSLCTIAVCNREESDRNSLEAICKTMEQKYTGKFIYVPMDEVQISSTSIRNANTLIDVKNYLPSGVYEYLNEHELYDLTDMKSWDSIQSIKEDLKSKQKPSRFRHTIGVMYTAASLSMRYSYPLQKAIYAGLLHDCAKYMSDEELIKLCEDNKISITASERSKPYLLHGKAGAFLCKNKYNVDNEEIMHAIKVHTTGCPEMSLLDKIIFVADYIEPNRNKQINLIEIRNLAFNDLDLCVKIILRDTIAYLQSINLEMDDTTIETYEYYKSI